MNAWRQRWRSLAGLPQIYQLVWHANPLLCAGVIALNLFQGLIPLAQAWLSKLVIDLIGAAVAGQAVSSGDVLRLAVLGAGLALAGTCLEPTAAFLQVLLGDHLKKEIQLRILHKANSLK